MAPTKILLLALCSLGMASVIAQRNPGVFYNPCWDKICHSYARCEVNGTQAVCVCPTNNCSATGKPVCGTNWKTYSNVCFLMAESCAMDTYIGLRYNGECAAGDCGSSVWQNLNCPFYSKCQIFNGFPRCQCPKLLCPDTYEPVCATDGRTYRNMCLMRQAACKMRKLLRVRNRGHCKPDPCKTHECCCRAVCRVNATNYATCACDFVCSQQISPVCGSDGRTYNSPCLLRLAACKEQNMKLTQVSNRACSAPTLRPGTNPCAMAMGQCAHYARCIVVRGAPQCVCPHLCPQVRAPICGSDGVTYENDCDMRRASCKSEKTIVMHTRGPCEVKPTKEPTKPTMDPCFQQSCTFQAECIVDQGLPKCVCPSNCSATISAICGSDGMTYENECAMRRAGCLKQLVITVASTGPCPTTKPKDNPCAMGMCAYHAKCIVVQGQPTCVCPELCPLVSSPMCGSNGRTYANDCALKRDMCDKQMMIAVVKDGPCGPVATQAPTSAASMCSEMRCEHFSKCEMVHGVPQCVCPGLCPDVQLAVCGSDGKTYENECDLRRTSCLAGMIISIVRIGVCLRTQAPVARPPTTATRNPCSVDRCAHHARCEVFQGQARCVCPSPCTVATSPVCGSDGRTYDSECALKRESCLAHKTITIAKRGPCEPIRRCPALGQCTQTCDPNLCSGNKLCCCQGCGMACVNAVWLQGRYVCPADALGCRENADCSGGMICCNTGCTRRCTFPAP